MADDWRKRLTPAEQIWIRERAWKLREEGLTSHGAERQAREELQRHKSQVEAPRVEPRAEILPPIKQHMCAALGCGTRVNERINFCGIHWKKVPFQLQRLLWNGTDAERDSAIKEAVVFIGKKEGKLLPDVEAKPDAPIKNRVAGEVRILPMSGLDMKRAWLDSAPTGAPRKKGR